MSLVLLGSAKGSPGVTPVARSLAVALASRGDGRAGAVLVDADADGGDLAFHTGLDPVPGIATLALEGRHGIDVDLVLQHSQRSSSTPGVAILAGVPGRAQAAVLDWILPRLAVLAAASPIPFVVDGGRLVGDACRPLVEQAGHVLVLCRPDTPGLVHARSAMSALAGAGASPVAVAMGTGRHPPQSLADALGFAVIGPIAATGRELDVTRLVEALRTGSTDATPVAPLLEPAPPAVAQAALSLARGQS